MATSTLVQFLETEANGANAGDSNRTQSETFLSGAAISQGDWVTLDTSKTGSDRCLYVIEAAGVVTVGNPGVIGVALEAATAADQKIKVCVGGFCKVAKVASATVAGSALIGPIGTAGEAAIEAPGTTTGAVCGIGLEADTANIASVMVVKRF
jgi:hypothetical protein